MTKLENDGGSVRVRQGAAVSTVKVIGRGTMRQSPAVFRHASAALAGGASVRVDLSDCAYMDSTFLGTLLRLARTEPARTRAGAFAVLCPSAACRELMAQMGVEKAIPTDADAGADAGEATWTDLPLDEAAPDRAAAVQETVVHAHQHLADTPSPGTRQFKDIAAKLAKAWDAQKGKPGNG
ncbi:MAG: STAS domain-containing protein [Phycisphaerae bacterium]